MKQVKNKNSLFVTDENELSKNSWNLLLRKESELEKYRKVQKKIIEGLFKK